MWRVLPTAIAALVLGCAVHGGHQEFKLADSTITWHARTNDYTVFVTERYRNDACRQREITLLPLDVTYPEERAANRNETAIDMGCDGSIDRMDFRDPNSRFRASTAEFQQKYRMEYLQALATRSQ